ncbi:MAG TPA: heparan-alpha-glucosaminide N-acetyltransferase domain-containing protein [Flavitalea sp.]|nr:heparan-alpha-glucosaminide N-acetyltransferase domain-containing protein [Flavitalea sp.]
MNDNILAKLKMGDNINGMKGKRIESIDLLRGIVMIIMALDHVRAYFHSDAFLYSPTDLTRTSMSLFFTRFITHYCAPVFVFLAGISAYLYGAKKSKKELAYFLFTRGLWLIFVELFIVALGRTFNPAYPFLNLQVIWAIGVSMIALSAIVYMSMRFVLATGVFLIAAHNLLDPVDLPNSFLWALLHRPGDFVFGRFNIAVTYPVIPWIGVISLGYYFGHLYASHYDAPKRKDVLLTIGLAAMALFFTLRPFNIYGDAAHWSTQKNVAFSFLSLLNVTKYPPSLLYILVMLGPALIFLALSEKNLNVFTEKIAVFGRVPFFYYVVHVYLIHLIAMVAAVISGYNWSEMILTGKVNNEANLKHYGFGLVTVYAVWIGLIFLLYPLCKWFDRYKRAHQARLKWLSYL